MKKSNRNGKETPKELKHQCDELWSKCVRARDKSCRMCNSDYKLSAHHIIERSHMATRHDLENSLTLCWRCHSFQKFQSQSFALGIINLIGLDEFNRLYKKSRRIYKPNIQDLRDTREFLKRKLKEFQSDYGR